MTTRVRLTSESTAPGVSPALQSYTHSQGTRRILKLSDSSALTTSAYTPDGSDHLVAGDAQHIQFVSEPLAAGIVFTNSDVIKYCLQALEAHAGNNLQIQLFVSVVSQDGGTVRRVLRSKILEGFELATSLTSRFHSTTQDGASYTTVLGDRLVVEYSVSGTPTGAGGVQGHNSSIRWGNNGAGGDLLENDTQTGTTLNPWIEFVPTITLAPTPTRGRVSKAYLEVPLIPTRGRISRAYFEVPTVPTRGRFSQSYLEVPNASLTPTRGRIGQSYFQIPNVPTRGRISQSYFEAPDPLIPTRGRISQAYFQIPELGGVPPYYYLPLEIILWEVQRRG